MLVKFDIYVETKATELKQHVGAKTEEKVEKLDKTSSGNSRASILTKEEILHKILSDWTKEKKIFGIFCVTVDDGIRKQFSFQVKKADADEIYERLTYNGFGAPGSRSVIITNDNKFCEGVPSEEYEEDHETKTTDLVDCLKSIQSQLTVHEVLANVRNKGQLSLDSVFQVITAGMIAMNGLAMDDPVIVVASMFIAPLMDVINMVTFAIRIQSRQDILMGAKIFFFYIGLMMCLAFVFSKPMQEWSKMLSIYMYGEAPTAYPTKQMTNRGHYLSLIGVALLAVCSSLSSYSSMLNGYNFNVHIGNAISLSLVPPVMNCGMMLVFGIDVAVYFSKAHSNSTDPCLRAYALCHQHDVNPLFNSSVELCIQSSEQIAAMLRAPTWHSDLPKLCQYPNVSFKEALISLTMTFLTAIIVILMGLGLMWMKKFTPRRLDENHVADFYKHDLDAYVHEGHMHKTVRKTSTLVFIDRLRTELMSKNLSESDCDMAISLAQRTAHFQTIAASSGNPAFSLTRLEADTATRRRFLSRQMSENQRTIRDTFIPEPDVFDSRGGFTADPRFDITSEKDDLETSPLRGSLVGRFHVTRLDTVTNSDVAS